MSGCVVDEYMPLCEQCRGCGAPPWPADGLMLHDTALHLGTVVSLPRGGDLAPLTKLIKDIEAEEA